MSHSTYEDMSAQIDAIKAFVAAHDIKVITAVQVSNPNRRVCDIDIDDDRPALVTIDYANILLTSHPNPPTLPT